MLIPGCIPIITGRFQMSADMIAVMVDLKHFADLVNIHLLANKLIRNTVKVFIKLDMIVRSHTNSCLYLRKNKPVGRQRFRVGLVQFFKSFFA